ncbi:hypothetical protein [Staphylococcus hominis]|uniref:hypothetical protein n=1 Tax=Staphylococcus hominis TaxID=1290 RepID=UPI00066E74BF|nr:hypothetical protein [Staphylococcus hominis]
MININIILNTQEHGYIYEHGAELLGSIITGIAFIFTFIKMIIDNNKDKKIEEEKNKKTLKMLDLISEKHVENIKNTREELENKKEIEKYKTNNKFIKKTEQYLT